MGESPRAVHPWFTFVLVGWGPDRHDGPVSTAAATWPDGVEPEPPRYADESAEEIEDAAAAAGAGHARGCRPTGSSIATRAGWTSTAGSSSWPRTRTCRCSSGCGSPRSSPATSTSSSWCASPPCTDGSRPASRPATRPGPRRSERLDRVSVDRPGAWSPGRPRCVADEPAARAGRRGPRHRRGGRTSTTTRSAACATLFTERIQPVLTPLAVDPAHPFPYISGLSLNLAVVVATRQRRRALRARQGAAAAAAAARHRRRQAPGWSRSRTSSTRTSTRCSPACAWSRRRRSGSPATRTSRSTPTPSNLLHALERELSRRRFGAPVRLEVDDDTSDRVLDLLVRELEITEHEVYRSPAPLDLAGLWALAELEDRPDLRSPAFVPETHPALRGRRRQRPTCSPRCAAGDVLLHHPYDSFATSVQAFIEQAATDPNVQAIKLTLYRTSGESAVVDALVDAARGRQAGARRRRDQGALRRAGQHPLGPQARAGRLPRRLRPRRSQDALQARPRRALRARRAAARRYVHVGTGNYNPKTARVYEDLGLLTADPHVGADVADLFNHLSGYTRHRDYDTLLVAPDALRTGLLDLIAREARRAAQGQARRHLDQGEQPRRRDLIDALYDASQAGVPIDLLVRGMCSLRPGVPGLSENDPGAQPARPLPRALADLPVRRRRRAGATGSAVPTSWTATSTGGSRRSCGCRRRRAGGRLDDLLELRLVATRRRPLVAADPTAAGSGRRAGPDLVELPAGAIARRRRPAPRDARRLSLCRDRGCRRGPVARATRPTPRWRWCTGRSTTTGRCPRASSTPASTRCCGALREIEEETGFARAVPGRPLGRCATPWTAGPSACGTGHCAGRSGRVPAEPRGRRVGWVPIDQGRGPAPADRDGFGARGVPARPRAPRAPASSCAMPAPATGRVAGRRRRPPAGRPWARAGARRWPRSCRRTTCAGRAPPTCRRCRDTLAPFGGGAGVQGRRLPRRGGLNAADPGRRSTPGARRCWRAGRRGRGLHASARCAARPVVAAACAAAGRPTPTGMRPACAKGALVVLHLDEGEPRRSSLGAAARPPEPAAEGRNPGAGGVAPGFLCGLTGGMSARTLCGCCGGLLEDPAEGDVGGPGAVLADAGARVGRLLPVSVAGVDRDVTDAAAAAVVTKTRSPGCGLDTRRGHRATAPTTSGAARCRPCRRRTA